MVKEAVPASIDSSQSLGAVQILRESFKFPFQNRKIAVSIMVLMLFLYSIFVLIHNLIAGALEEEFEDQGLALYFSCRKILEYCCVLKQHFLLVYSITSLFGIIIAIYATAVTMQIGLQVSRIYSWQSKQTGRKL